MNKKETNLLQDLLPNGKTVLPAEFIINKMGSSIVVNIQLNTKSILRKTKKSSTIKKRKTGNIVEIGL